MFQANITACSLVTESFISKHSTCEGHTVLVLLVSIMKSADFIPSRFEPMQSRFPYVSLTSARFYLPSTATVPVFPYPTHFGASYVSPDMYSVYRDKDIRLLPSFTSQCYQSSFQGMPPYHSINEDKPTQSYIGLIGKAILSSPQQKLVLGDIYNYILTHYPYFRNKGPGWRNSIRHNLSLNDCFVKVGRSPNGKGHFWEINPINYEDFSRGDYKRKRAPRRNRESFAAAERSKEKTSGKEDEIKTRKDVSEVSSSETTCNTVCHTNGTENRGFHIDTILYNKVSAFTVVPHGFLSAAQNIKDNTSRLTFASNMSCRRA